MAPPTKILFVCLGNTCRSPMAESVMRELVKKHKLDWEIDSAALRSWNVGYYPERRCLKVLDENGLQSDHLGRELREGDYHNFDYILGMDEENFEELLVRAPSPCRAQIELLGSYMGPKHAKVIADPYFDKGIEGFRHCFDQISTSCKNFLKKHMEL